MKFSIIIPVYNVESYLKCCIDSVVAQDFQDWECICVDDGSDDGSSSILDTYALSDSRFVVIHKTNAGVSSARNAALGIAKGEWVLFLDSDDVLMMRTLSQISRCTEEIPDAEVIGFGLRQFDNGEAPDWGKDNDYEITRFFDCNCVLDTYNAIQGFTTKAYRRNLIGESRFPAFKTGEDLVWMLEVMLKARKTVNLRASMYGYRMRQQSATHVIGNLTKIKELIEFERMRLNMVVSSSKRISKSFIRSLVNSIVERCAYLMCDLDIRDRKLLCADWYNLLGQVREGANISWFCKFRIDIILSIRSFWVVRILCVVPYTLKLMGLHR